MEEGNESAAFWDALGGEEPYPTGQRKSVSNGDSGNVRLSHSVVN